MLKEDYLVQLIKSLSPNEKRNFRLSSDLRPGEKKYIRLFELIEESGDYNAPALAKRLNITGSLLAAQKHYLNQALLTSLLDNRESVTEVDILHINVEKARVLTTRRLYDYALVVIGKALRRAWELESFELVDNLLLLRLTCMFGRANDNDINQSLTEYKKTSKILIQLMEMRLLASNASRFERGRRTGSAAFKKLMQHPLLKRPPERLLSLMAKAFWYQIMYQYCVIHHLPAKALEVALKERNYYKRNPGIKLNDPVILMANYTRVCSAEFATGNFKRALEVSEEFELFLNDVTLKAAKARIIQYKRINDQIRIYILFRLERFDQIILETKEVELFSDPALRMALFFFDAAARMHLQRPAEAIDRLNRMFEFNPDHRTDLHQYTRLLMIMAHMDMGNFQLIPYQIKSAKSWMKRNKYVNAEFDLFFSLIAAVVKAQGATPQNQAYRNFREALNAKKLEGIDNNTSLRIWIERKINEGKRKA